MLDPESDKSPPALQGENTSSTFGLSPKLSNALPVITSAGRKGAIISYPLKVKTGESQVK